MNIRYSAPYRLPVHSALRFCRVLSAAVGFILATWESPLAAQEKANVQDDAGVLNSETIAGKSLEQMLKLEVPMIESASKFKQPENLTPSAVSVIKSDEIKLYGYRTLADILESARGLHVSYDRNYSYLGERGFNKLDANSRVLVLIDGHRINNNLNDGAAIGTDFLLDVDLIDRVEIIRGPSAVLYGNNAFFGVVNVISRKGHDFTGNGAEVSGEIAGFDTYKGRASYGKQFKNGIELLLSGTYYDSEGQDRLFFKEFDSPATQNGIVNNGDADSYKSFFGKLAYSDFSLQGGFSTREKGNPTAQFGTTFGDTRTRTTDDRSYAALKYDHNFEEFAQVTAQLYYDRYDLDRDLASTTFYKNKQMGEWWGTEVQLTRTFWERHQIIFGGEYRDDFHQKSQFFNQDTGEALSPTKRTTSNYGIFLNGDFGILTNLHLNAGVRYDQYGDVDATANPRIALIYNPIPSSSLKAIYGTAFRAPNFLERTLESPSEALSPEKITTYELAYEQEIGLEEEIGAHLRSTVALFYNEIDDLISLQPDPLGGTTYQNAKGATAKGVEFELEGAWAKGIRTRVSCTYQETEDRVTHQILADSPRNLLKANVSVPLWKDRVFASLEYQYTTKRNVLAPADGATLFDTAADAFGMLNFTLFGQNLVKGLDISASIYNLLDNHYSDPATPFHTQNILEQDGRTFRVKLTYRF